MANRVEAEADVVDMESAAVAQFCFTLDRKIKVGVVRVISEMPQRVDLSDPLFESGDIGNVPV